MYFFLERYAESFTQELREFVESFHNDITPPVIGIVGRIPVVMGMAALKSYQENRPVKPSEIEGLNESQISMQVQYPINFVYCIQSTQGNRKDTPSLPG